MENNLYVYLYDDFVGILKQEKSGRLFFTYDSDYLNKPAAIPLSIAMPLQADPYPDEIARPFFQGYYQTIFYGLGWLNF